MRRRWWVRFSGVVAALATTAIVSTAWAAPPAAPGGGTEAEARARYSRGVELYNEGVYGAALVELERAQALAPHYGILHSIALVKVQLADFVGALSAFEEYLVAGGDEISAQRKTEVREKVAQLRERVGTIELTVDGEGAEVLLDDNIVGLSPMAKPIRVNPGKHEVVVRRPGEKGESKKFTVAGGDKLKATFDPSGKGSHDSGGGSKTATKAEGRPKWLLTSWIVAGAFAAGATASGIVALGKASDLKSKREDGPASSKDLNDLGTQAKTWAIATDVLVVPAVALAAINLYFTFRSPTGATETPSVGFRPQLQVGVGRVGVGGTF